MTESTEVVKVLMKDRDNRFLMLRKASSYKDMGDRWEQPGGKVEEGEDRFQAAKREVEAETGLETSGFEDLVRIELESGGEAVDCYVLYTEAEGGVELSDEHQDFRWVAPEEAEELEWHRDAAYILPVIEYLDEYREGKSYGTGREINVVKTLIEDSEGRFLAVKKSHLEKISSGQKFKKYGDMSGKWELPGGRIRKPDAPNSISKGNADGLVGKVDGEDRFEAAEREIREELGVELWDGEDVVREEIEEENDVNVHILLYRSEDWSGELRLSEEHSEYMWVTPEEYLELDWHADAGYGYPPMKFLEDYLDR